MTFHYSQPFEFLIENAEHPGEDGMLTRCRALIVGSGYGGAVAALRLACGSSGVSGQYAHDVMVLERGKEYALGEFPTGLADLPRFVSARGQDDTDVDVTQDALFDLRRGTNVDVLVGSGLGGTSLINANVAMQPSPAMFDADPWPRYFRTPDGKASLQQAFEAVRHWLDVPLQPDPSLQKLAKYCAIERLAKSLVLDIEPAPINVALDRRKNYAGVWQNGCTKCGNCVTGCNVGSKSTLAMNLIPAAHASGAEFFTGAVVYSVEPIEPASSGTARWRVYVKPTSHLTRARFGERYYIEADTVVLAAGTLGSTEILQRSAQLGYLKCSSHLGRHFSTNGDGVAASFCESEPVNAVGSTNFLQPRVPSGPTITACVRPGATTPGIKTKFLLEDGAIPAPLVEVIGEVMTTAAQFGRLGYNRLPAWLAQHAQQPDPLAVHRESQEHGQVFLVMCDDGARGTLSLRGTPTQAEPELGTLVPEWSPQNEESSKLKSAKNAAASNNPALAAVNDFLGKSDRTRALNQGQFLNNPAWRLLPESASNAMDGAFPGDRLITVHPLGGCRMADSGAYGVVDHDGRLFVGDTANHHPGLYVLDGSILPCALGENPFLTIAALAWRACDSLAGAARRPELKLSPLLPPQTAPQEPSPADAQILIREQLIGALPVELQQSVKEQVYAQFPGSEAWFERDRLVLRLETHPADTEIALRGSGTDANGNLTRSVRLKASLYLSPIGGDEARRWKTYGISSARLGLDAHGAGTAQLIASGQGSMTIMDPEPPAGDAELLDRRKRALDAYRQRRTRSLKYKLLWPFLSVFAQKKIGDAAPDDAANKLLHGFLSIAEMQTTFRTFTYDLALTTAAPNQQPIRLRGQKRLAWSESRRLWTSFTQLDAKFTLGPIALDKPAKLYADMDYLVDDGLLSVATDSRNAPRAIFNCIAYVARLARAALQVGFWEFGAPDYPDKPMQPDRELPNKIGKALRSDFDLEVPLSGAASDKVELQLHRYCDPKRPGPVVLLLHGLAQGSLIFAHRKLKTSMVRYLVDRGHDVWLLDYRLSPQRGALPPGHWSIDEIGEFDIPGAVGDILTRYPDGTRLHVFAHCVGAAAIAMAILRGYVRREQIASVALNAVHPWVMPSPYNLVRAKVGAAFGDHIAERYLDPLIHTEDAVSAPQTLLDRCAFSIARFPEREGATHDVSDAKLSDAICDRMTFLYGRMWGHANVRSVHGAWQDLVGKAPADVYRHLYYMLARERIVDCEGNDDYIDILRLQNWAGIRTLFLHGEESEVFNPQSATRSAIRLSQAIGATHTPVRLRRIPEFGHMDPILADRAPQGSFQYLDHFFQGHFDHSAIYQAEDGVRLALDPIVPSDDPEASSRAKLHCGPVLRSMRIDAGKYLLRYWFELPTGQITTRPPESYLPAKWDSFVVLPPPVGVPAHYVWIDAHYKAADLPELAKPLAARVKQLAEGELRDCHFIVASCCYPGTPFDREHSDAAYAGINALLKQELACDALFLIGDQIYADATAGVLDPYSWRDRYEERYWAAFNAPHAQRTLARVPTHFAIDDHEIANDFSGTVAPAAGGSAGNPNDLRLWAMQSGQIEPPQLEFAKRAAVQYMGAQRQLPSQAGSHALWYALDSYEFNCPAFVMDTRSERTRAGGSAAQLIESAQLAALKAWLSRVSRVDKPKFVFTGSVIAPLTKDALAPGTWMREDGLVAYRAQLDDIMAHIVQHQVQGVVFVAGDLHLSCVADLTLHDKRAVSPLPDVRALQIVSSGLYAPMQFANTRPDDVVWNRQESVPLHRCTIGYLPERFGDANPRFVRVSAVPGQGGWDIVIAPYDVDGRLCGRIILKTLHIAGAAAGAVEPQPAAAPEPA